jgi:hypothetical protein
MILLILANPISVVPLQVSGRGGRPLAIPPVYIYIEPLPGSESLTDHVHGRVYDDGPYDNKKRSAGHADALLQSTSMDRCGSRAHPEMDVQRRHSLQKQPQ